LDIGADRLRLAALGDLAETLDRSGSGSVVAAGDLGFQRIERLELPRRDVLVQRTSDQRAQLVVCGVVRDERRRPTGEPATCRSCERPIVRVQRVRIDIGRAKVLRQRLVDLIGRRLLRRRRLGRIEEVGAFLDSCLALERGVQVALGACLLYTSDAADE